jgi:hypothetical protein
MKVLTNYSNSTESRYAILKRIQKPLVTYSMIRFFKAAWDVKLCIITDFLQFQKPLLIATGGFSDEINDLLPLLNLKN